MRVPDVDPEAAIKALTPQVSSLEAVPTSVANTLMRALRSKGAEATKNFFQIPGNAMQGAYAPPLLTPGQLSEEDIHRQDAARKAQVLDAFQLSGYGLRPRSVSMLKNWIPETVPWAVAQPNRK